MTERRDMEYRYCEDRSWEDFSSGRVLRGVHGAPNFPVRLGCELYRRALSYCEKKEEIRLYDCCCGGGYLLTVLGLLNQATISHIYASDIGEDVLETARKNLSLLSREGMKRRTEELSQLFSLYRKPSHAQAVESAGRLAALLERVIPCTVFQADAGRPLDPGEKIVILITDVPYGELTAWEGQGEDAGTAQIGRDADGLGRLIRNLTECLGERTLYVIVMDKGQKLQMDGLVILEKGNVGKRRFYIFRKTA